MIDVKQTMDHLMILNDDCHCMTEFEYDRVDQYEKRRIAGGSFTEKELNLINKIYKERML